MGRSHLLQHVRKESRAMPETEEMISLEEQQAGLVDEFLFLRQQADLDAKGKRNLAKLTRKLDELYWKRVEELLVSRVAPDKDELAFSDDERLLIDVGLLDSALVDGADDGLSQQLLEEINTPGPPNHFYLSEWLEDRYRRYRLDQEVSASAQDKQMDTPALSRHGEARVKILNRLAPMFSSLPGVSSQVANFMVSGGLDEQILKSSITLLDNHVRKLFVHRSRLTNLRLQVLAKARTRARDQSTLKLFDMVDNIYAADWRERYREHESGNDKTKIEEASAATASLSRSKVVEYLVSELRFAKTLMPLGALAGGVTRSCAVLLETGPRVTKADTERCLALTRSADRDYALNPVVLIAPFRGRGIFEWDRDSLVVSLVPVDSAEDSIANAAGNYRMLMDSFQGDGALRAAYEAEFPDQNFQQAFQADYRAWVTRVGHGDAQALDDKRKAFFRKYVGPECEGVLAPANLKNLGPQTRKAIRHRLEKQVAVTGDDANLRQRLAVLCWQDGDLDAAFKQMALAARLAPKSGDILFSLGLLLRAQGLKEKAVDIFRACARRVPDTIWGVYATDAAEGRIFED